MVKENPKRALVVEFFTAHHETLIPQVYLLEEAGYAVWVAVQRSFADKLRTQLPGRKLVVFGNRGPGLHLVGPWLIFWTLLTQRIHTLAINSVLSTTLRYMVTLLWLLPHVRVGALAHGTNRLGRGGSQSWIEKRIKHWWVLSTHQLDHLPPQAKNLKVGILPAYAWCDPKLPVTLPSALVAQQLLSSGQPANLTLAIPGHPDALRRDYAGLFDALEKSSPPPKQIQFWLLGNYSNHAGPTLIHEIKQRKLEAYFRWGSQTIPFPHYHALLMQTHGILPLLHSHLPSTHQYQTSKISGAFNLAIGHQKIIALPKDFLVSQELVPFVLRYDEQALDQHFLDWCPDDFSSSQRLPLPSMTEQSAQYLNVWNL